MLWDTHMHTGFSGDSDSDPDAMVRASIDAGLSGICFTDHLDWDYREEPGLFDLDLPAYAACIRSLQNKYQEQLPIRFGIELGLQPHLAQRHEALLQEYDFDFCIGSSHVVHGVDPYYAVYYEGRSEEEGHREYFSSIIENIDAFDGFDVYGHLDYVVRYGPNGNRFYTYEKYKDQIDEILALLIEKGKGIEVNTAGFKYGLGHPNPTEDVIRRYQQLGGKIITLGADGHKPEHVAYDFGKVPELLKACGFNYYCVFRKREPEFISL